MCFEWEDADRNRNVDTGGVLDPYSLNPVPDPAKNLNPDPEDP